MRTDLAVQWQMPGRRGLVESEPQLSRARELAMARATHWLPADATMQEVLDTIGGEVQVERFRPVSRTEADKLMARTGRRMRWALMKTLGVGSARSLVCRPAAWED